jgi:hypothetical protein
MEIGVAYKHAFREETLLYQFDAEFLGPLSTSIDIHPCSNTTYKYLSILGKAVSFQRFENRQGWTTRSQHFPEPITLTRTYPTTLFLTGWDHIQLTTITGMIRTKSMIKS